MLHSTLFAHLDLDDDDDDEAAMYVEWVCRWKWPLTAYCLNLANELSLFFIGIIIITVIAIIINVMFVITIVNSIFCRY